jgi:hypothetical protein
MNGARSVPATGPERRIGDQRGSFGFHGWVTAGDSPMAQGTSIRK